MTKIVTLCGSMKYKDLMIEIATKLQLENNYVVLQPIYPIKEKKYTKEEIQIMGKLHLKRIEISDAIYIINKDNYIGEATKKEIEYAKKLDKEIIYYVKQ